MKNLMQKLVKTTLCVGVVSLTLIACEDDVQEDTNIITLDQLDSLTNNVIETDTTVIDSADNLDPDGNLEEPADKYLEEDVEEKETVEKEEE